MCASQNDLVDFNTNDDNNDDDTDDDNDDDDKETEVTCEASAKVVCRRNILYMRFFVLIFGVFSTALATSAMYYSF